MLYRSPIPDVDIPVMPLTDFVFRDVAQRADKPAMIDAPTGRTYTYAQLFGAAQRLAAGLAARGFKKGDVFGVYLPNLPEYAIVFHGVALAGGVLTTVNPLYTAHELAMQMRDSGAKYLLTIPLFLDNAKKAAAESGLEEVFVLGEAEGATPFMALLQNTAPVPQVAIDPKNDLVVLPYSSGTTGLPKGVMLSHYNLVANLMQIEGMTVGEVQFNGSDTMLGLLPFYHIYGMVCIMNTGLALGATVVTMPRFDMEPFLQTIQNYKITWANLVPPLVLALAKHPLVDKYDLSSLKSISSGAAPLGKEVEQAVEARLGCLATQGYGLTETSPVTHFEPRLPNRDKPGSIGILIPNTAAQIVDLASGEALGPGAQGELWIRGPQVMQGYHHNPEATARTVDADGWLHTGDVAVADADGYFWILDRIKELIKYKGLQVAPAELEAVLVSHPAVADAAVIGRPDPEAGEIPKAFVVRKAPVEADELMAFVAERVAPHKKIRFVEFVDVLPRTASGKILRRDLLEQERARMGAEGSGAAAD
ncbi:MAG: 4-coumarate--CoA ligase family protein [Anaerolineae bacterium]